MSSTSPTASPTIAYVVPCSLAPRRTSSSSASPPLSPLVPSTPPAFHPEYITTDTSLWAGSPRLVRFDNECVVIPESEWFPHSGSGSNADDHHHHHNGGDSPAKGLKAVFGLNKMKKVVMVNKSYSLPLWTAGSSPSKTTVEEVSESGTEEDEAPTSTPKRKVMRLHFKVPIPTFSPERPQGASRHPHLRSPSYDSPSAHLPHSPRGRKASRSRSPPPSQPPAVPLSPILVHRTVSTEVPPLSPTRAVSPLSSPLYEHHPHNALYTNPRTGDPSYFPPITNPNSTTTAAGSLPSTPGSPHAHHHHHGAMDPSSTPTSHNSNAAYVLPELVPLRPCCEDCSKALEEAVKQGEEWKERFTRGARRRRRRSSSAASGTSTSSALSGESVNEGSTSPEPVGVIEALDTAYPAISGRRPSLTVSTTMPATTAAEVTTSVTPSLALVEETDEESEVDIDPSVGSGKLTHAVVDEVAGLRRRSASGGSLNAMMKGSTIVDRARPASETTATATPAAIVIPATLSTPSTPSSRAFLDVPVARVGGFHAHERVASGGSMSSIASSASAGSGSGSGSGNESSGSLGSRGSRGSRGSTGSAGKPGKSILKNTKSSTAPVRPELKTDKKRHTYHGYPTEKERAKERELTMVNTLLNMDVGSKSSSGRGRGRGRDTENNGSRESLRSSGSHRSRGAMIDLGGDISTKGKETYKSGSRRKVGRDVVDDDEDELLFPLPRSPRSSPGGSPDATPGITPRASMSNTPEQMTPRGGSPYNLSPRVSPRGSPRSSPRASPRVSPSGTPKASPNGSPRLKPSPLSVISPVIAENMGRRRVVAVQGDTDSGEDGDVIKGSLSRKGEVPVFTRTVVPSDNDELHSYTVKGKSRNRETETVRRMRPAGHGRTVSEPATTTLGSGGSGGQGTSFPEMLLQIQTQLEQGKEQGRSTSSEERGSQSPTSPSDSDASRGPAHATGTASSSGGRGKQTRKNSGSFSAIGRNLRALKGVGVDMLKGVGSMSGMGGAGSY